MKISNLSFTPRDFNTNADQIELLNLLFGLISVNILFKGLLYLVIISCLGLEVVELKETDMPMV